MALAFACRYLLSKVLSNNSTLEGTALFNALISPSSGGLGGAVVSPASGAIEFQTRYPGTYYSPSPNLKITRKRVSTKLL